MKLADKDTLALEIALRYHEAGELQRAGVFYEQFIHQHPEHSQGRYLLALARQQAGQSAEATRHMRVAIELDPDVAAYHHDLGLILERGQPEAAVQCFREALRCEPDRAGAYAGLGRALLALGHSAEALGCHEQATQLQPDEGEFWHQLGCAYWRAGHPDKAVAAYRKALILRPGDAEVHHDLGLALRESGDYVGAEAHLKAALAARPDFPEAHNNLGTLYQARGDLDAAKASYQAVLRLNPSDATALYNLGGVLSATDNPTLALQHYRASMRIRPLARTRERIDGLRLRQALVLPPVYTSRAHLEQTRQEYAAAVDRFLQEDIRFVDPLNSVGVTAFHLAYHGYNDRELQQKLAALFRRSLPKGPYRPYRPRRNGKIRVGFVSTYFCNHTIGKLSHGTLARLSRAHFEVSVFSIGAHDDAISRLIRDSADEYLPLPNDLPAIRAAISARDIDVLVFTDIGMEPVTYFLAFSRLAPVQCATWGHPLTTGIDTVDYFISSEDTEIADGQQHYTEELVRLRRMQPYYYRPNLPARPKPRSHFGLSASRNIYVCPQSLFKFHPDFDALIAGILRADRHGELILLQGPDSTWQEQLTQRFKRDLPDVSGRIRFLPRLRNEDFLNLILVADVMLDTVVFCGGNTTYEGLATGTPIVTLPSEFLRGRLSYGIYRKMGVLDCVACSPKDYIDKAVRLGTDKVYQRHVRQQIRERSGVLYEDPQTVTELERFLIDVTRGERHRGYRAG